MKMTDSLEQVEILGVPVTILSSYNHAVEIVINRIKHRQKTFCVAINPIKIYHAQSNMKLKQLIDSAHIQICDGVGTSIAGRILYGRKIKRITGVQLFHELITKAEKEGLKVFLLGATQDVNNEAYENLLTEHPNLQIVGRYCGYFNGDNNVVRMINDSSADMLFVAMGSPRQEHWIAEHINAIKAPFIMGIGGTLDVVSGHVKWAPNVFRRTGMEFIYRLMKEPKRIKQQKVLPKFVWLVLKSRFVNGASHCRTKPLDVEYSSKD
jgi:N-acetylglucosaminyldiphosphoundecaprenol N-acetyl-beta-D-mannosaminyltransferase